MHYLSCKLLGNLRDRVQVTFKTKIICCFSGNFLTCILPEEAHQLGTSVLNGLGYQDRIWENYNLYFGKLQVSM